MIACDPTGTVCTLAEGHAGECLSISDIQAQLAEARAVLKEVEWCCKPYPHYDPACPACEAYEPPLGTGHAPDCRLKKALGET